MTLLEQLSETHEVAAAQRVDRRADARNLRHNMPRSARELRRKACDLSFARAREFFDRSRQSLCRFKDISPTRGIPAITKRVTNS